MPFRIGPTELIIILAMLALILGARRLPQIGSSMGRAIGLFHRGLSGVEDEPTEPALGTPIESDSGPPPKSRDEVAP